MSEPADLAASPRDLLRGAAAVFGEDEIAAWCGDLLAARAAFDDPELPSLLWLGGRVARWELEREAEPGEDRYWPRVWGARGLLYVWRPPVGGDVVAGLGDPAWRVREMCAKAAALRELGEAAEDLAYLLDDGTPRVRAAAARALGAVGEGEHALGLRDALLDPDEAVREAASRALDVLRERLDRDV
ncbi:hypothetical protein Afil01_34430 [Actinorhabdospora filicis]|uniref:HEAT repeat domain-containing protein n=1 Tax=Actinorhabdospora filicis TaxID=1785913 RepID=A0A9W6WAI5_9ACTN|nr:HEAT repeat domain-containing protein [Actinorhabdospora filicis]GLZ78636.1 hypothetical protein Afil01_34430 [Actinorhabdospora filicis]